MRSVIGDYIHLTSEGYSWGILPKIAKENFSNNIKANEAIVSFQAQRTKMQTIIEKKGRLEEAEKIQNAINNFKAFQNSPKQTDKDFFNTIIKNIENEIGAEIDSKLMQVKPSPNTADEDIYKLKRIAKSIYNDNAKNESDKIKQVYIIKKTIDSFIKHFQSLEKNIANNKINTKQVEDNEKIIEEIMRQGRVIIDGINKMSGRRLYLQDYDKTFTNKKGINTTYAEKQFCVKDEDSGKMISFIDFIETLQTKLLKSLSWGENEKKGKAFELLLASASTYGKIGAGAAAQEYFKRGIEKDIWKGTQTSRNIYIKSNFISDFSINDAENYNEEIILDKEKSSAVIVKTGAGSADKIDLIFYYDQDNGAKISAKNYAEYTVKNKGFGGVSGAPFLSLIQNLNPDFVNHWINSTITHAKIKNFSQEGPSPSTAYEAHQLMEYALVLYGALGGTTKYDNGKIKAQEQADYLVWNNNTTGEIQVYPFSTVLKDCEKRMRTTDGWIDKTSVNSYGYFLTNEWSTIKFFNDVQQYSNTPEQIHKRILAILAKLHQIKITTHFFLPD